MESLYTKYRPQTFQDVVGQEVVVSTLENAVLEGRTGHAYLFCGPRGTGKTTMARLLAKALMCEEGPNHLPDGTCEQCRLIAAGEHPDVYELDAASRTGVDNVREEIINRVSYAPVRGRYKVYIIDEVHMLTTAAFNALLKTLEEPPDHVVFVLCTTDPQKIPATIISRVQRFDFHAIGNDEIRQRLAYVCQQEGFSYDDEALDLVVRHARGGMRDALSTLEQLSVFGNGNISADAAQDLLGSVPGSTLDKVCDAMAARDVATLYHEVGTLADAGSDLLQFVRELAARVRDVYVVSAVGAKSGVVAANQSELEQLQREAREFGSSDRLAHVLTVLGDTANEMRTATNQRLSLEIALTRIARPQTDLTLASLADRVAQLEQEVRELTQRGAAVVAAQSGNVTASGQAAAASVPVAPTRTGTAAQTYAKAQTNPPAMQQQAPLESTPASRGTRSGVRTVGTSVHERTAGQPAEAQRTTRGTSASAARPIRQTHTSAAPGVSSAAIAPRGASQPTAVSPTPAVVDAGELQRRWRQAVDALIKSIPSRGSLLMSSAAVSDDGATLTVSLPKGSTFALKMLGRADVRQAIEPPIAQVFGGTRELCFVEAAPVPSAGTAGRVGHASAPSAPQPVAAPRQPQVQHGAAERPQRSQATPAVPQGNDPTATPRQASAYPAHQGAAVRHAQPQPERAVAAPQASPAATGYAMPWDPVAPVPEEPPREEVPYGDADAVSYDGDAQMYEEAPAKPTTPQPSPAQPSATTRPFGTPAPSAVQSPTEPAAAPGQLAEQSEPQEEAVAFDADSIPDDIPDDLRNIIEDCFEVFGDGVKISSVPSKPSNQ